VTREGPPAARVTLRTIALEWGHLGVVGFGGPPTHIALLRKKCVQDHEWIDAQEFEDAIAATNLLPGPASTQLAIFCAWRLRGARGAIVGGLCFIFPGLILIVALAALFLAHHPPNAINGAAAGAGAAVPGVALYAASRLVGQSRQRMGASRAELTRWFVYALAGGLFAALLGSYVVLILVTCGAVEFAVRAPGRTSSGTARALAPGALGHTVGLAGLGALTLVAIKVGALSYGGGFVIIPLMQHDVVSTYHWMSGAQFLNAVALGQVTPGPVVLTVAVVGYAVAGIAGALLATVVVFTPSFLFVLFGARHFNQIRSNHTVTSFLTGASPAVIGAIAGSAIPLGLSLHHLWQVPLLAAALLWLFVAKRGVVSALLLCGAVGIVLSLVGVGV
jgi:chromate transporter